MFAITNNSLSHIMPLFVEPFSSEYLTLETFKSVLTDGRIVTLQIGENFRQIVIPRVLFQIISYLSKPEVQVNHISPTRVPKIL